MRKIFGFFKFLIASFLILIFLIWILEKVVDYSFDNAATKDACMDAGGAWSKTLEKCVYNINELPEEEQAKYHK